MKATFLSAVKKTCFLKNYASVHFFHGKEEASPGSRRANKEQDLGYILEFRLSTCMTCILESGVRKKVYDTI